MDLVVTDSGRYYATIGLGADEKVRDGFEGGRAPGHRRDRSAGQRRARLFADVLANEVENNPDGTDIDSNPAGLARAGDSLVVADAGGNAIVKVNEDGGFRTVAALDPTSEGLTPCPPRWSAARTARGTSAADRLPVHQGVGLDLADRRQRRADRVRLRADQRHRPRLQGQDAVCRGDLHRRAAQQRVSQGSLVKVTEEAARTRPSSATSTRRTAW